MRNLVEGLVKFLQVLVGQRGRLKLNVFSLELRVNVLILVLSQFTVNVDGTSLVGGNGPPGGILLGLTNHMYTTLAKHQ